MPAASQTMVYDGFTTQASGMNDGRDGSLLQPSELQLLVNGTCRGDFIKQRPGYRRIMQVLPPSRGLYQHAGWLRQRNGEVLLAVVAGGRFFSVDPLAKSVAEFTIPGDANPSTLMQGWSMPGGAEGFWVYQDGQTLPLIWSGASARRARPKEIKPGKVMCYVQGRIWYSLPDGLSFRAGDLVGNPDTGTAPYARKDSILSESENTFLNEGGDFGVPSTVGDIRAMAPTAVLDTSQGQGPLQVFTEKGGFSVNTPVDRTIWKTIQYPIMTTSLLGNGYLSAQSTVNVNSDIFGRAKDGVRTFKIARRNFNDWGNTPQSNEVSGILKFDQADLLQFSSSAVFDNRFLTTCSPFWSGDAVAHRGLIAMDLAPISTILRNGNPHYDGIWTGLQILTILQTDIGAYMTTLCSDGSVDLWEISKDGQFDYYDDQVGRIQWSATPRKFFVDRDLAGRPLWNPKRLETGDLFYDELVGGVDFSLSWAPDSFPCFTEWKAWEECAPVCNNIPPCPTPKKFKRQYRPRFRLPKPPDVCAVGSTGMPLRNFYQLNLRVDVTGPARITGFRVGAILEPDKKYDPNCDAPYCVTIDCCGINPFGYVAHGTAGGVVHGYGSSVGGSTLGGSGIGTGGTTDEGGVLDGTGGVTPVEPPVGPDNPPPPPPPPDAPPTPPEPPTPPPGPPAVQPPANVYVPLGDNVQVFQPFFEDDQGNSRPMGFSSDGSPLTELQPGILELWEAAVLEQFTASGIVFTAAQMYFQTSLGDSQLRYNPNLYFDSQNYGTAAWKTELWIEYIV